MASVECKVSLTETEPFRRLVTFVEEVERYADEECDLALKDLVESVREDLLRTRRE